MYLRGYPIFMDSGTIDSANEIKIQK